MAWTTDVYFPPFRRLKSRSSCQQVWFLVRAFLPGSQMAASFWVLQCPFFWGDARLLGRSLLPIQSHQGPVPDARGLGEQSSVRNSKDRMHAYLCKGVLFPFNSVLLQAPGSILYPYFLWQKAVCTSWFRGVDLSLVAVEGWFLRVLPDLILLHCLFSYSHPPTFLWGVLYKQSSALNTPPKWNVNFPGGLQG